MSQLTAEKGTNLSHSTAFRALHVHVSDSLVIYIDLLKKVHAINKMVLLTPSNSYKRSL